MQLSPWTTVPARAFAPLARDVVVDVAVVGGGITGVTAALLLKQRGYRVALLERDRIGRGDTGHTTAHLTAILDRRPAELVGALGADHAGAALEAGFAALDQIARLVRECGIRCAFDWVPGVLHARPGDPRMDDTRAALAADLAALDELGIDAAWDDAVAPFATPGVRVERQARIRPHLYVRHLAALVHGDGSAVFEHSAVTAWSDGPRLSTAGGAVTADRVVMASHTPLPGLASSVWSELAQTRVAPYTTYALRARAPRGAVPDALFWDTGDPYRFLRVNARHGHDDLIFGGGDHRTGQPDDGDPHRELERALLAMVPGAMVDRRWSGQVWEPTDGLPFIGESAPGQFSATGFSGNGLTFGTLAAMMAADWVTGVVNPWQDLFAWSRAGLLAGGARNYLRENVDYPYYRIRDALVGPRGRSLRAIARGQGAVVDVGDRVVAAYRDDEGTLWQRDAACTHQGCRVTWNDRERTWDCPCHGSRFAPSGAVIAGPATDPLPSVDPADAPRAASERGAMNPEESTMPTTPEHDDTGAKAPRAHATTTEQIKEMEGEGQAQAQGTLPSPGHDAPDQDATAVPDQEIDTTAIGQPPPGHADR